MSKLNEEQVLVIRSSAESTEALAERFGCSPANIDKVRSLATWWYV